jgi:hypothetical protein
MTSGHIDEIPAKEAKVVALLLERKDLVEFLRRPPIINRTKEVPYLGGKSKDGAVTYIHCDLPEILPQTGIEPDFYIHLHETAEWWCMTNLGLDYLGEAHNGGHPIATRIEHMALGVHPVLVELGIIPADWPRYNPDDYEDELSGYIAADESEGLSPDTLPPDLFLGPYEDDQDATDRKVLPFLYAAAVPLTGQKLGHETVSYGPGEAPEQCRKCEYSDHGDPPICHYVLDIVPDGWCVLWDKS